MAVHSSVQEELSGVDLPGWKRDLILALAASIDAAPNASSAKELRSLMDEVVTAVPEKQGDVSDDLAAKRAARRQAAG